MIITRRSSLTWSLATLRTLIAPIGALLLGVQVAHAQSCATTVASVDNNGLQGGDSYSGYGNGLSSDGRWALFSTTSKLVAADTDLFTDVYLRDRLLGTTELVSVSSSGVKGIFASTGGQISPDGRFVTFGSSATNLVAVDINGRDDTFLRDRWTGTTTMISVGDVGQQGNLHSYGGSMSADGRFVAFWSGSTNLTPNDTNGLDDVFVWDATTGKSTCVSRDASGTPVGGGGPILSGDARYICFGSPHVFPGCGTLGFGGSVRMDLWTGAVDCLNLRPDGTPSSNPVDVGGMSADGRYVAVDSIAPDLVPGDTNNKIDVFVRDMVLGKTERVSVATGGVQANSDSETCRISANGRFVAFETSASNLYPGGVLGWRIVVRDRWKNTTTLASQNNAGVKANDQCLRPTISPDGTCVAFDANATNLIDGGDTNGFGIDVIVRECTPSPAFTYCVPKQSSIGCIPAIVQTGGPSSTAASGFDVQALGVINQRNGILTYGLSGQALMAFAGGYLCVQPPLKRLPPQNSGGTPTPTWDCTGVFHFDFNTWIHGGNDPALVAGATVWAQWWYRDSGFPVPNNVGLTDAIEFTIQ